MTQICDKCRIEYQLITNYTARDNYCPFCGSHKPITKIITLPNGEKINVDWSGSELEKHVKVIDWDYRLFSGRKFAMISHDGHDDMIWIWFNNSETKITAISGFTKKFLIEYKIWKRHWWN